MPVKEIGTHIFCVPEARTGMPRSLYYPTIYAQFTYHGLKVHLS